MVKIITLYNNKGGVSKTTTLFNLAVYLSQNHKKILIADCDPQCNVTELFFASSEIADDPDKDLPGTSIYQALKPRFHGEIRQINPETVELVASELYPGLYLLRGDPEFTMAETYFANAWKQAITEDMHEKNTYVALYRFLHALANKHSFDYILCDVGPSTGAITRMVVLTCDGYFLPLTPDRFSNQAIEVLGKVLSEWFKRHAEISKTFEPYGLESFPGRPILLGAIIQDFKIYSAGKIKASYEKWQIELKKSLKTKLLAQESFPVREDLNQDDPFVAAIRDVGPLAPVAQKFGCAIFDVRKDQSAWAARDGKSYYGVVWQNWEIRKSEYRDEIKKMSEVLP
ncbi:MAG: Nitrogenase iron protein [Methanosaeta sp. PtaB.Bin087]|jgi:cellulose biosynthesis protein BcsQ|nr:MAG: Nitrogenase iron protein [Methanosaeta sp. PtaB.Bin087]